jgi:uncharacterized protein YkwD
MRAPRQVDLRKRVVAAVVACVVGVGLGMSAAGAEERRRLVTQRGAVQLDGPYVAEKQALLGRINEDRRRQGAGPLRPDGFATTLADAFCAELVDAGALSHYDAAGRPPYLRWVLAGGIAYHGENVSAYSSGGGTLDRAVEAIVLDLHASMIAETAPDDGHRRLLLNGDFTQVGIGIAVKGGQLRLCEEFSQPVLEWADVPARPAATGQPAAISAQPSAGWEVVAVEILHEDFPPPRQAGGKTYEYPPVATTLYPARPAGFGVPYSTAGGGTFTVGPSGRVSFEMPLRPGPGHSYAIFQVRPKGSRARPSPGGLLGLPSGR